jgi:hypothetical protein
VSNGLGLTAQALIAEHAKAALGVTYTDAYFKQTVESLVSAGDSLPVTPWNVTASLEQSFSLPREVTATLRVEDVFRSTTGCTYACQSAPRIPPYPSTNVLNGRAAVNSTGFEVAALVSNALNAHPTITGIGNGVINVGTTTQAITLTPRTISLSATWRF